MEEEFFSLEYYPPSYYPLDFARYISLFFLFFKKATRVLYTLRRRRIFLLLAIVVF